MIKNMGCRKFHILNVYVKNSSLKNGKSLRIDYRMIKKRRLLGGCHNLKVFMVSSSKLAEKENSLSKDLVH